MEVVVVVLLPLYSIFRSLNYPLRVDFYRKILRQIFTAKILHTVAGWLSGWLAGGVIKDLLGIRNEPQSHSFKFYLQSRRRIVLN